MLSSRLSDRRPSPVILRYYLFQSTASFGFVTPVFTLFLLWRDLTYTQIGTLGSVTAVFVVLGEIPTGYVGDRFGRKSSLLVGTVLLAVSLAGFVVARSFPVFVFLYVLWALGVAFRSGSGDAWLYEILQSRREAERFTHVRGRGTAANQWTAAAMMLTAGVLYGVDPRLPFVVGTLVTLGSFVVLLTFPESDADTDAGDSGLDISRATSVLRQQLSAPPLRSTVLFLGLFFGVTSAANTYVQPIVTGPVGLSESSLGPLYAGFTVVTAAAGYSAGAIEARLTTRWAIVLVPLLVGVFLLVPLFVPVAALPTFVVAKSARSALTPIASGYVNDTTGAVGRATVLSAASMVYALIRTPIKPLTGLLADATSPLVALACLGGGFLVAAGVVLGWELPVTTPTERPSTD